VPKSSRHTFIPEFWSVVKIDFAMPISLTRAVSIISTSRRAASEALLCEDSEEPAWQERILQFTRRDIDGEANIFRPVLGVSTDLAEDRRCKISH
jgi:hypothetical protein